MTKIINKEDLNKIDLYSFGVTLYLLTFETLPYGITNEVLKDTNKIYNKIVIN